MFRLIRYAILGVLAYFAATWISESRGDMPATSSITDLPQISGEPS